MALLFLFHRLRYSLHIDHRDWNAGDASRFEIGKFGRECDGVLDLDLSAFFIVVGYGGEVDGDEMVLVEVLNFKFKIPN